MFWQTGSINSSARIEHSLNCGDENIWEKSDNVRVC